MCFVCIFTIVANPRLMIEGYPAVITDHVYLHVHCCLTLLLLYSLGQRLLVSIM